MSQLSPISSIAAIAFAMLAATCASSDPGSSADAAAGAAGAGQYKAFAGCTRESAVPATQVGFAEPASYAPRCVRVSAGASLVIQASTMHPLQGMTDNGDTPNPIAEGEPSTGYLQDTTFTFPKAGSFGFFCNVHGSDTSKSGSMTGVVYVD
ncbi:MAG: hypothetical protein HY898_08235 [Deltaproteobacteria bacterium]|nr:hypothetical protein [Deltaproteobacteria bacterium]